MSKIQVMKRIALLIILIFLITDASNAQKKKEEKEIKKTINLLFDGMRNSDTTVIRQAFAHQSTMETIASRKNGSNFLKRENVDEFIKGIGSPRTTKYDERIKFKKVLIDSNLASVWTNYQFYIDDKFSHCGVNSFQLFKGDDGWKIIYIVDTRRKDNCN